MTAAAISSVAPFFIVANVTTSLAFYQEKLGFDVIFRGPAPDDEFFGIVRRGGAMIMFKALGGVSGGKDGAVEPVPNFTRKPAFSWDAYLEVPDPDALAAEFARRAVVFALPLADSDDGLRGFVVKDADGYGLYFGTMRA